MNGGTYECDKCGYRMAHFTGDDADNRLPCLACEGWMYPVDQEVGTPRPYKEPNWFWRLLWKLFRPISEWADRHMWRTTNDHSITTR